MSKLVSVCNKQGEVVGPGERQTPQNPWTNLGDITVAEPALAVDERTITAANLLGSTKAVIWDLEPGVTRVEVRYRSNCVDGEAWIVPVYILRIDDEYLDLIDTLTLTRGLQVADTDYFFIDTIAQSGAAFLYRAKVVHSGADYIARYVLDVGGYEKLIFIASTIVAAKTLQIDGSTW